MRAAYIEQTGGPEVIRVGELPTPEPGPGQALVKVGASSFNPIDIYIRAGTISIPMPMPYIVGCDLAGTVEKVGPGVDRVKPGDRVWCSNQGLAGRQGATAEYAAVDQAWLHPTAPNLSDAEAASMALVGITAHLGLFLRGRLAQGESLYVPGGAGGVGSMVIQMARAAGARVATSAGSPERIETCRQLGADLALNYKTDDIPAKLKEFAPEGLDLWYETQREPNLDVIVPLMRKRSRIIVMAGRVARPVLPLGAFYTRDCALIGFAMFNATADEQAETGVAITRWAAEGKLRPLVGPAFPLDQAAEAQRTLEEKTLRGVGDWQGKVVVTLA